MKNLKKLLAVALLTFVGVALPQLKATSNADTGNTTEKNGAWVLTASPYIDPAYLLKPVVVHGVTSEANKALTVTRVQVRNFANPIKSVRLRWYVTNDRNQGVILQQGETPDIKIAGGINTGETREIEYDVVSFLQVLTKLRESDEINGIFRIDVAISTATFDDGSVWKDQLKTRLDYMQAGQVVKAAYKGGAAFCTPNFRSCGYNPSTGQYNCNTPNPAPVQCVLGPPNGCTVIFCG